MLGCECIEHMSCLQRNEGEHPWRQACAYTHTYIIIIMVLSNLSVSDVSIYFVWLTALLVMRDELEHLWRAISCCRLNRSPQVSHLNGSFARSATVILLLTVPQSGIWLLCRFKSCGRLNCFPHRSQDICKASLSTAVILRLFVICSIVVVIISSAYIHTYIHTSSSSSSSSS